PDPAVARTVERMARAHEPLTIVDRSPARARQAVAGTDEALARTRAGRGAHRGEPGARSRAAHGRRSSAGAQPRDAGALAVVSPTEPPLSWLCARFASARAELRGPPDRSALPVPGVGKDSRSLSF